MSEKSTGKTISATKEYSFMVSSKEELEKKLLEAQDSLEAGKFFTSEEVDLMLRRDFGI